MLVGLCDGNFPPHGKKIGDFANSFAISSYGNFWIDGKYILWDRDLGFTKGNIIGCGVDMSFSTTQLFFTKNGTQW